MNTCGFCAFSFNSAEVTTTATLAGEKNGVHFKKFREVKEVPSIVDVLTLSHRVCCTTEPTGVNLTTLLAYREGLVLGVLSECHKVLQNLNTPSITQKERGVNPDCDREPLKHHGGGDDMLYLAVIIFPEAGGVIIVEKICL